MASFKESKHSMLGHRARFQRFGTSRFLLLLLCALVTVVGIWQYQIYLRSSLQDENSATSSQQVAINEGNKPVLKTTMKAEIPPGITTDLPESFVIYKDYCIHHDVITPRVVQFDRIAQILHLSAEMLSKKIIDHTTNWQAPISLTVFTRDSTQYHCTIKKLKTYTQDPTVRAYLRVHLLIPRTDVQEDCKVSALVEPCPDEQTTQSVDDMASYPANVARNTARMFSQSKYILVADFEHMFSEGFESDVRKLAETHLTENPKTVLVYRIFEVEKTSSPPKTITDLHELMNHEKAVVFHQMYYKGAHNIEGIDEWFSAALNKTEEGNRPVLSGDDDNEHTVLNKNNTEPQPIPGISQRNIKYDRSAWEPQFVSLSNIPMHDELFPFLIRDNTCLRWELCRSGYAFDLLSNHFMYHMDIKTAGATTKRAALVQKKNHVKFKKALQSFNQRMDLQYPQTKEHCPTFKP